MTRGSARLSKDGQSPSLQVRRTSAQDCCNPRPMHRNRRFIALWSVLLLFQWNLLGSGFFCATHQRMSGTDDLSTYGEMAVQMPHRAMVASAMSAVAAGDDAGSCTVTGETSCRANQLPGGSACGAMSSCASTAALSLHAEFASVTGRSTPVGLLVATPLTRSTRPDPRPPRA